jgi:hypothetical protein
MKRDLPLYDIGIDLNDPETTVSFNSLVKSPAHEKQFETFSLKQHYQFNDDEQSITGVMIAADTPIYRYDSKTKEEYYVQFGKQAIKDIVFDYARRGNFNNVNIEHDGKQVVEGIFMTMLYTIDEAKGFTAPERFKDETDGTVICSYKITDSDVYQRAKDGEFKGFSIEGVFALYDSGKTSDGFSNHETEIDAFISSLEQIVQQLSTISK